MFTFKKKVILTWMVDSIENLMGWLCYERQIYKGKIQSSNTNKIDTEQVLLQISEFSVLFNMHLADSDIPINGHQYDFDMLFCIRYI